MCGLHSCGCCGGMWSGVAGIEVHFMSHAVCHHLVCAVHGGVGCAGLLCGILLVDSSSSRVALLGGTTRELC